MQTGSEGMTQFIVNTLRYMYLFVRLLCMFTFGLQGFSPHIWFSGADVMYSF